MPAALPLVAGALAGFGAGAMGITVFGLGALGSAMAIGAITGGVVGGIQSAIEGGDILEGVLYGAVGGAVGGAIGGAISAYSFGVSAAPTAATTGTGPAAVSGSAVPVDGMAGVKAYAGIGAEGSAAGALGGGGAAGGGVTMGEMMLAQGGIGAVSQALAPEQETPFGQTEAGVKAELESREKIASMQASTAGAGASAQLEAARVAAEQRMAEAELQATLTREKMNQDASEFQKSIAQRNIELERPIQEYYANLRRQRETATGLTLARKLREQAAPAVATATTTNPA